MKANILRSLLYLLLVALAYPVKAQFPVVNTHPSALGMIGSLSSGWRLMEIANYASGTRTIYDLDMSVYRVLNFPSPPSGMQWANMSFITEDLFDTDPSTIEFIMGAGTMNSTTSAIFVFREDGTELFQQNPAVFGISGTGIENFGPIYSVEGETFMALQANFQSGPTTIYQLPGQLPCKDCTGSPTGSGVGLGLQDGGLSASSFSLYPNPTSTTLTLVRTPDIQMYRSLEIFDAHGRLVMKLILSSGPVDTLQVNDLPAGTYHCQLVDGGPRRHCGSVVIAR